MIRNTHFSEIAEQLEQVSGKAEIVRGELVSMSPAGWRHNRKSLRIVQSLLHYEDDVGGGVAFGDNAGFVVDLPERQSFSPDAAWLACDEDSDSPEFIDGAPTFAIELRSKNDYGPSAELAIAAKIAEYFAAGTQVVWDVDLESDDVIRCYRATSPTTPQIFRRGEVADAEPAVPGWRFEVDELVA